MKHGTTTAYHSHGCRCDICRAFISRHHKRYRLDRLRGVERLVDAQPLRDHVQQLRDAGMSFRAIALAAGWASRNALSDALNRPRVSPKTMARVLAVNPASDNRGDKYVDATATRRRLQALQWLGWPSRAIAKQLGNLDPQTYQYIANGRNHTVRKRTETAIAELYDELWDKPGPSQRTKTLARKRGYLPPLAWDDDTIADPDYTPGETVRKGREGIPVDDVLELYREGHSVAALAQRFGCAEGSIHSFIARARKEAS